MNYLIKCKSLLLICIVLQACSITDKTGTDNANDKKATSTTIDQTKKKGIVLINYPKIIV